MELLRHAHIVLSFHTFRKNRGKQIMNKPTYYLWRNDFSSQQEFEEAKVQFLNLGFRVVVFLDGSSEKNIHDGLKSLIKNHI